MTKEENTFKYFAFISYKSEDVKWAIWLQKRLEKYSLPVTIQKKYSTPKKLSPIFRDGTDILPKELKIELNSKLEQSKYLIVLCSPGSASSDWVGHEIDDFCKMGRRDKIIAVIINGIPYSNNPMTECYHPKLKEWFPKGDAVENDRQLLGADIHSAGPGSSYYKRERAFMQVVATMLELPFDSLWNRRQRQIIAETVSAVLTVLIVLSIIAYTWYLGRPFDVNVTLNETTPHNQNLPFREGIVTLISGKDTLGVRPVNTIDEEIVFTNIPGKFRSSESHLTYEMFGYQQSDTMLSLSQNHQLNINRSDLFAIFAGHITKSDGVTPLSGVLVNIDDKETVTDSHGYFEIQFPIEKQQMIKHVIITKEGYNKTEYDLQPQRDHSLIIL